MEKKEKIGNYISIIIILFCYFIIYVLPVSSNLHLSSQLHGDIYRYSRLLIAPLGLFSLIYLNNRTKKQWIEYLILLFVVLISFILKGEIPWTSMLLLIFFVSYDGVDGNAHNIVSILAKKNKILKITIIFILQIILMFIFNMNHTGALSTFKDPNYTGYFLILLYYLVGDESNYCKFQKRDVFLLVALLTFSRTALLSILIIYFCRWTKLFKDKSIARPQFLFYVILILWLVVCKFFAITFEKTDYVYQYRTGFSRFTNIVDYSNYIRTVVNVKLVEDINPKSLLVGYTEDSYSSIIYFEGKTAHPHNLFFSIYAESGIIFSLAVVDRVFKVFKNKKNMICMYFVIIVYSMLLGPSSYYGTDMLLIWSAIYSQDEKKMED